MSTFQDHIKLICLKVNGVLDVRSRGFQKQEYIVFAATYLIKTQASYLFKGACHFTDGAASDNQRTDGAECHT